jgi:hypothetical protein
MILVRDVFRLKFGKARDARALMKEATKLMPPEMAGRSRSMFDLTGPAYTLVWEMTVDSLAAWEKEMSEGMSDPAWREWYQKFVPLVDSSCREIFTIEP